MKKKKYYAYVVNDKEGVTDNWAECLKITSGVADAKNKSFESQAEAERWLAAGADYSIKHIASQKGIYFDAGTGGGMGTEVSVTDERGNDLLGNLVPKIKLNDRGKHLLPSEATNNYGELLACKYAMQLAIRRNIQKVFGDSKLVLSYWSKGAIKRGELPSSTVSLAIEVKKLRVEFENGGGVLGYISGGSNPADLGFHK